MNPIAIGIPHKDGHVLLDMAMSQFSNGKLDVFRQENKEMPVAGGYTNEGKLTTNPGTILESNRPIPIGFWKGSGLAFVLDLMATLITGGNSTVDIGRQGDEYDVSQVFLAFELSTFGNLENIERKTNDIIQDFISTTPIDDTSKIRYPGQGMLATRKENLKSGIPVSRKLWDIIQSL